MIELGDVLSDLQKSLIAGNQKDITQLLQISDRNGMTLLHWAAVFGSPSVVRELLRQGADNTKKDGYNRTAQDIAIIWGHKEIANMLK